MSRANRMRALCAATAGVLALGIAPALRADQVVNQFNTADEAAQWNFEFGSVGHDLSWDPSFDANGNPASGSLKVTFTFDATLGGDNKGAITRDLGSAAGLDGTKFTGISMDIALDPNSATDAFGANGYGSLALRNGPNWDWMQQFGDNLSAAQSWRHISVSPLQGTVDALHAITFQIYGGPAQNITGPVTFWIDNVVFDQPMIPGDVNLDGKVDFSDLLTLAQHYGMSPDAVWADGDFNNDGSVGFDDLLALAQNYGTGTAAAQASVSAVPEPAGAGILGLGAVGFLRRRRR